MRNKLTNKEMLIAAAGCAAGILIGSFGLKKIKKELRAEIISETSRTIKNEIKEDIQQNINMAEIKNEITNKLSKSIVNDILDKNEKDMKKVKKIIDGFEDKLDEFEDQVLDFDKRVGKLINGGISAVFNNINKGRD